MCLQVPLTPLRQGAPERRLPPPLLLAVMAAVVAAHAAPTASASPPADRSEAVRRVAREDPRCVVAQPFYWVIGDASGRLIDGQAGPGAPGADTEMPIASASKWLYAAHVAEVRGGRLQPDDIPFLNFTSGYTGFTACRPGQTVAACQALHGPLLRNGDFVSAHVGRFFYSGGHMQKHAVMLGLGGDDNDALARHVGALAGTNLKIRYVQPQLAGGVATTAGEYGRFLQRTAAGELQISHLLGANAVCTLPSACPQAVASPMGARANWHYAAGHWVEDEPGTGDGAFSSPGAFGFYPWLSQDHHTWGIVARHDRRGLRGAEGNARPAMESVQCGRAIRAAWFGAR